MPESCPYCGREYADRTGMFKHAMTRHREAVLAHLVREHDFRPKSSGQQMLGEGSA